MAAETVEIVKSEGNLTVSDATGKNQKAAKIKDSLPSSNILSTGPDGRAVVRVGNTGYIVLEKNSTVEINTANDHAGFFRQISGMIYYAVNSINKKDRTLEVRIKTATMGIRGTRFIVTEIPDRNEVGMRKGTLSVSSAADEFEIHKKSEQDEFEALKRESEAAINEEKNQFEKYKEDTQHDFVEYKREFALGMDRMVSFNGKRVDDKPLSGETKKDMESLEGYAGKWLSEVQD
jgi:RNase P/RNase MRP subunit p29